MKLFIALLSILDIAINDQLKNWRITEIWSNVKFKPSAIIPSIQYIVQVSDHQEWLV